MQTHAHFDIEMPVAASVVWSRLSQSGVWPLGQPLAADSWTWLGRRWHIRPDHDATNLRWQAETADAPAWHCYTTMQLLPAATSTHLRIHVALDQPTPAWALLRQWWETRHLQRNVQATLTTLKQSFAPVRPPVEADFATTHPYTAAAFEAMNAAADLERIRHLDARWATFERGYQPPLQHTITAELPSTDAEYDVVYAGGGLVLLHAALLAQRGYRVLVFDRNPVGSAHREWNISHDELNRLVATDLLTWDELEREIIMARYADGVVRYHAAGSDVPPAELRLPGVLDVALDAGALLRLARQRFADAGGHVREGACFAHVYSHPDLAGRTVVALDDGADRTHIGTRLLIDGMGATSPLTLATQPFSGICPTVGTVVRDVAHDPSLGDILISVADTQGDKQLIWEGFPGRDDELTVYVFYYDRVGATAQQRHSLLDLFEEYFTLLPTYKTPGADFAHLRPVYGYIPARHALKRPIPLRGVLPLGDASAQQSPLTFCGFGSFVRNLDRTVSLVEYALQHDLLAPDNLRFISAHQANVSLHWVFSRFMSPWGRPQDVNELQNVFARVMNTVGIPIARRFFRDQMTWRDYRTIIMGTLHVYPAIIPTALRVLGWRDTGRWIADWLRFSRTALQARLFRGVLPTLIRLVEPHNRSLALRWRAAHAEWQAMGWAGK